MAPEVALSQALHLQPGMPLTAVTTPLSWLVLGPVDLVAGCFVLFPLDALARSLGVPTRRRAVLALLEAAALWNPIVWNWHPEDPLAVAFGLYALLAAFSGRWRRCGWLLGAGVAFQPLVLVVLPAILALAPRGSRLALVVRSAVPATVLLAGPLAVDLGGTLHNIVGQPSSYILDHPTPWTRFAHHLGAGRVQAGPPRTVAVALAAVIGWSVCRRTSRTDLVIWVVAATLAVRNGFEAAMVGYYTWPALAVALLVSARAGRVRFAATGALVMFATGFAELGWRGPWAWWSVVMVSLVAVLALAFPVRSADTSSPSPPRGDRHDTAPALQ
jgi:hypothetical protein